MCARNVDETKITTQATIAISNLVDTIDTNLVTTALYGNYQHLSQFFARSYSCPA